MNATLSAESANWLPSSRPSSARSVSIDFDNERPIGVTREGMQNYVKHCGSLNLGDWAIEGRRTATPRLDTSEQQTFAGQARPAKVIGAEALKNYVRNVTSTPNLLKSDYQPPNPHHNMRVKREGRSNYVKDRDSRVKSLFENYGKFPSSYTRVAHVSGEVATNIYHQHRKDRIGPLLGNYAHFPSSPKPIPHVKGEAAEDNLQKGLGRSNIIEHKNDFRPPVPDPHVKGVQAEENYDLGQGRAMSRLLHEYGTLPQSARTVPRVKYGGVPNHEKGRGDAMRKTISQCPPSNRRRERPLPVET